MRNSGFGVVLCWVAVMGASCGGDPEVVVTRQGLLEQRPRALFVVGSTSPLSVSDDALRLRLVNQLGLDVDLKTGPASATADATGKSLILISQSVNSADVNTKFRTSPVPAVVLEHDLFDDMLMTGSTGTDHNTAQGSQINIVKTGHPLAAGLPAGLVTVTSSTKTMDWGLPGTGAVKVGQIASQSSRWGIFSYEPGAALVGGTAAAAARVGLFVGDNAATALTTSGWALFDAAVKWSTQPHALLVVATGALSSSDQLLRTRLQNLGYQVEAVDGPSTTTAGAIGKAIIVLSESIVSTDVNTKFTNVVVPIVGLEPALFDDLRMTGTVSQTNFGDAQSQSAVTIVGSGHPLAAGLSGQVAVVSPANKFVWGAPAATAAKVATLVGQPTRYAIFGYEAGAAMVTGTAPARRVGWFAGLNTPAGLTSNGLALFDAAVKWAAQPQALLVVGALPLSPSDALLRNRLESPLGFRVEVTLAVNSQTSQATGKAVIVVSDSSLSTDINTKFRNVATPVLTMEPDIYDDMQMTAAGLGTELGNTQNQTQLNILDSTHPLADGLTAGIKTVTTAPQRFGWGKPSAGAAKIASIVGQTTQIAIFGYEKGATMVGLTAPGRRVGFPPGIDTPAVLNAAGLGLFDAAVRWASGQSDTKTSACAGRADGASCSDGNACNGAETCHVGICRSGSALVCGDNNPCTSDACDAVVGCKYTVLPAATSCSNGNACDGNETCNSQGICQAGTPITCDDGNLCTSNNCNPSTGTCSNPPLPSGSSCGVGKFCTGSGTCNLLAGTTANTVELVSYEAAGYRYFHTGGGGIIPSGFAGPTEPAGFQDGAAAFGSGGGVCPLRTTVNTLWPTGSQIVVRRSVFVPVGVSSVRLMISVDNSLTAYWDGAQIGMVQRTGCSNRDELLITVPAGQGAHLLALQAVNVTADSFLDVRVIGECDPQSPNGANACGTQPLLSSNHNNTLMDAPREQGLTLGGAQGIVGAANRGSPVPRGVTSHNGALVDNLRFSHVHESIDYKAAGRTATTGGVGQLPELEIRRYHRPRAAGIWSSFGPGVCSNFDTKLELHEQGFSGEPNVFLFEPERDHDLITFIEQSPEDNDNATDGLFHDRATREWKSIELLDSSGQRTSNHALAATAVLLAHTGERYKFEVIVTDQGGPGVRQARLTRIEDRNGEAITISYVLPANETVFAPDGDRTRLWQIQAITDAYGLSAAFHYLTIQMGAMWVVDRINLPNTGVLNYQYGGAQLQQVGPFLQSVIHPDGTFSTFTLALDAASQLVVIGYDDNADGSNQFRESVYVTPATVMIAGVAVSQPPNLVRKIVNGDGELMYQNFENAQDSRITYIYEGGSLLTKLELNASGYPEFYSRAISAYTPGSDPSTAIFEQLETYEANEDQMLTKRTDALGAGRVEILDRDPATRAVTKVSLPFDPSDSDAVVDYNQFRQPIHTDDRLSRDTDYTYDSRGNLLTAIAAMNTPVQATWQNIPNARGQVTATIDANGNRTDYEYFPSGRLAAIVEPPDTVGGPRARRTFTYDAAGRASTATDAGGRTVTYDYDLRNRLVAIHHPDLSSESFTYGTGSLANLLISQTDRNGIVTAFEYDQEKRLRTTIMAVDLSEEVRDELEYVPGTLLVSAEIRRGERKNYQRDGRNRPIATTTFLPGGRSLTTQTIWDPVAAVDRVTKQIDAYGRSTFMVYDVNDRVSRTIRELVPGGVPSGADLQALARNMAPNPPYVIEETVHDSMGQVTARIDGRGFQSTFTYDERGRQTSTVAASGTVDAALTTNEYDAQGNLTRVTHPRTFSEGALFATEYAYTGRNLLRLERVAAGTADEATSTTTYTLTGRPAAVTDARGNSTTFAYNACCDRLSDTVDPTGATTHNTYDPEGNLLSVVDPNGNATTYQYDGLHRRTSMTNPELETVSWTYDDNLTDNMGIEDVVPFAVFNGLGFGAGADGAAVMQVNALGERLVTVSDGLGRTVRTVDGNGNATNAAYDQIVGGLVETTQTGALGHTTGSRTDGAGRERERLDAEGRVSRTEFDANGNRVAGRDPNQIGEDCVFDARNRSIACQDTQGDVRETRYDAQGNVVTTLDGFHIAKTCVFDARDRRRNCTDRIGATTTWTYDANSNLATQTDAENGTTTYQYDARNLRVLEDYPPSDGSDRKTMTYDPGGRLKTRTDQAGATVTHHYDGANRLVRRQYPDGLDDVLVYDNASRLLSASSARYSTVVARSYDPGSRLTSETQTVLGSSHVVGYGYDAENRKISVSYPDGSLVARTYTDRDQLATVSLSGALVASRVYDPGMRLQATTLGNGLVETRSYRADNTLLSLNVPGVHGLSYTYDPNKRKTQEAVTANPTENQTFSYDAEDRLTVWGRGGVDTQSWSLSPVGDWNDSTRNGVFQSRTHNRVHEITSINSTAVTHDAKGNLTQDDRGSQYFWDYENRLSQARRFDQPGVPVQYFYDALGRRLGKNVSGTNVAFVFDGDQVVAEYENGTLARRYVYGTGIDEPLALATPAGLLFYSQNHLDSGEALTNAAGVVVERYRYDSYGARQVLDPGGAPRAASLVGNQVGFTGRYHDADSGLLDFRSRQYDTRLGRFVSREAVHADGMSLYAAYFVPNGTDPTGQQAVYSEAFGDVGPFESNVALKEAVSAVVKMAEADSWRNEFGTFVFKDPGYRYFGPVPKGTAPPDTFFLPPYMKADPNSPRGTQGSWFGDTNDIRRTKKPYVLYSIHSHPAESTFSKSDYGVPPYGGAGVIVQPRFKGRAFEGATIYKSQKGKMTEIGKYTPNGGLQLSSGGGGFLHWIGQAAKDVGGWTAGAAKDVWESDAGRAILVGVAVNCWGCTSPVILGGGGGAAQTPEPPPYSRRQPLVQDQDTAVPRLSRIQPLPE